MTNLVGVLRGDKIFKRVFFSTLLLLVISALFLSSFTKAFAREEEGNSGGTVNPLPVTSYGPGQSFPSGLGGGGTGAALTPAQQASINGVTGADPASDAAAREAVLETPVVVVGEIDDPILKVLHAIVVTGLGWLVGMFGYLFDFSVNYFIIGFGDQFVNYNVGSTVDDLWSTVRDIFNLTFIFGLVYIGFKMILDSSDSSARKMLVSLIAAALLINFSLFITKFIVDFSNIAAFQVYKAFSGSADGTFSITEGFMNLMGIRSLIGVTYVESGAGGYQYIIGLLVVFLVLAYVFLAGAIMIIVRFALLTIYMIFSPVMFLGWVFPSMKGKSSEYWSGFLGQAFFAPAFIFMLYLSYKVADSYKFGQKSFEHLFNASEGRGVLTPTIGGIDPTVPYFAMVIVFLVASIVVAKKMGAHGASVAVSTGKHMAGRAAGGLTVGLAARVGRTVVGGSANALTQSKTFRKLAANTGFVGKGMMLGAGKVADSSFDLRNAGGLGKSLGMGAGKKGGFTTRIKESKESDNKYNELLGKVAPEDNPEVKRQQAALDKLKNDLNNTRDDEVKDQINGQIKIVEAQLKTALKAAKEPEQVYANQLTYMRRKEAWLKKQKALLNGATAIGAGVGLGLLTGGVVPGVIAAAGAYGASKGINGHTKADIKAIEKEYGDKGQNKDKNEAEKAAAKAIAKALKDAGEAPKPKEDDH